MLLYIRFLGGRVFVFGLQNQPTPPTTAKYKTKKEEENQAKQKRKYIKKPPTIVIKGSVQAFTTYAFG